MIEHLALAILLSSPATGTQADRQPIPAVTSVVESDLLVRYRFSNPKFVISRIELTIDGAGRGTLTWARAEIRDDQSRDVVVSPAGILELRDLLTRLDFVKSTETYQTPEDHSNLGETRILVEHAGSSREAVFNYTKNRDADALGRLLRGIANREMYVSELEVAVHHQPLETPAAIAALAQEFKNGRIGDAGALLPLLQSISDDASIPVIARNRAAELASKIRDREASRAKEKAKGR